MEGSGRFWQFFAEDQSVQHTVSNVSSQPRAPRANFYDPAEPWGNDHLIHHALRPGRPASGDVGLVTPRFIGVKNEGNLEARYPGGDAHHVAGQAEVSGITAIAEPEEQDTEIVEVEDGSKDEDSVDLTGPIDHSLTDDPIISDANLEVIRVNRRGAPPLVRLQPQIDCEAEGRQDGCPVRNEDKLYCAETYRVEKGSWDQAARQIEQGLAMGSTSPLSNFAKEDHGTMAVFIELWSSTLIQRVWVSTKALLGSLRIKLQQKVDAAAIEDAVLLAVGLVSSLLDTAANHQRVRAPDEGISRTDLHKAAREMAQRGL